MDPKLNPVVRPVLEVTLVVVVPPNNDGFDVAPKENPDDCVVVVTGEAAAVLPKENNGFAVPDVPAVVVVEADPKVNPVSVPFELPNIF